MLVSFHEILQDAYRGHYAVGAFNCLSVEQVLGTIKAAEDLRSPVILQLAEVQFPTAPMELMAPVFLEAAGKASVPVAVHLDHGQSLDTCVKAIALGFNSVMFDGADLCFEDNVSQTAAIVRIAKAAGVDASIFCKPVLPGTPVGELTDTLAKSTGIGQVKVVSVAGHDTASAVAAVPALDENFAYLSSGTWSLMGIESQEPVITPETYELNFTNEGGVEGTTRFLKNICGMWILEQCRKEWAAMGKDYSYPEIVKMAMEAEPFKTFIQPDDSSFANPPSMLEAINAFCERNGQPCPENDAQIIRCIFESLALRYRQVLADLDRIAKFPIERLHIIGGGSKNDLLNQFTANAINRKVIAGPSEATAIGNVMIQAMATGIVSSLKEMRTIIHASIETKEFVPQSVNEWEIAYQKFITLK